MTGMSFWTIAFLIRMCFVMMCLATFSYGIPQFQNGKYKDIVVVVNERIENSGGKLKDTIQEFFKEASKFLYSTTKEMASFQDMMIIAPKIWEATNEIQSEGNAFLPADIRIDEPNPEYGDAPYTVQQGECGEPGKYIHLTPGFFKMDLRKAARLLVHEWVHLRYGVFDEHSLHQHESSFRWEGGQILPPTCPGDTSGWIAREEGRERCSILCGRVKSDCKFYPDPSTISEKSASIMSHPHLENVDLFCNSSNHNKEALFPHNRMCNGMSTYEVIMRHEDFNDKYRIPVQYSDPIFSWKQGYERRIVFVIDASISCKKINDTRTVFYRPIARFVLDQAPSGSYIGVVTFSNNANIISQLVGIENTQNRETLKNKLNDSLHVVRNEPIGNPTAGIKTGVNMLDKEGGMVILMSASENLDDMPNVETDLKAKVVVNVIAFGNKTNANLEHMTKKRGWKYYFLHTIQKEIRSTDVDLAIITSVTSVSNFSEEPVIVKYERLQAHESSMVHFFVDELIGKNTTVTAVWRGGTGCPEVYLTSPSGKAYTTSSDDCNVDDKYKEIIFRINDIAETGTWKISWDEGQRDIDVIVTSKPKISSDPPIRMHAWIARAKESSLHGIERYYRIFAELKMGYDAVVNANVIATFEFVGQGIKYKTLRDDGSPPDVRKNDGIYANYMPLAPRQKGRPVVIVRANNRDKIAKWRRGSRGSGASFGMEMETDEFYENLNKKFGSSKRKFDVLDFASVKGCEKTGEMAKPSGEYYNLKDFDRVAMVDSPLLSSKKEDEVNQAGPPPIRDLIVKREANESGKLYVVLQWTVPEDPRPGVKVSKIELRGSANRDMLNSTNFENAPFSLTVEKIDPPGQMQELEVELPAEQEDESKNSKNRYFFAMKAVDTLNVKGNVSNIAEAFLDTLFLDTLGGSQEQDQPDDTKNIFIWSLSGTGGLLLLVFIILCLVFYLRKRKGTTPEEKSVSYTMPN